MTAETAVLGAPDKADGADETVVVGTSRLQGDRALIVLLTAVSR